MKTSYLLAAPLLMSLCVMPVSASARDHQSEHNTAQRVRHEEHDRDRHQQQFRANHLREQHAREEHERMERRAHEEGWSRRHQSARRDHRDAFRQPAGVDHRKKRGWQGRDLPPGQAKKS